MTPQIVPRGGHTNRRAQRLTPAMVEALFRICVSEVSGRPLWHTAYELITDKMTLEALVRRGLAERGPLDALTSGQDWRNVIEYRATPKGMAWKR